MRDELKERRIRGLDKKIDLLTLQISELWHDIYLVEQGNADLIAQRSRSRFRLIRE
jgi:hypothetical protein